VSALLRPLTRAQGSLVRHLLQDKKSRLSEGAFVIEGAHACRDLLLSFSQQIISLTVSARYLELEDQQSREARNALRATQYSCPDETFEKFSEVDVPQGILAVVRLPKWNEREVLAQKRVLGVYGERLQDPQPQGLVCQGSGSAPIPLTVFIRRWCGAQPERFSHFRCFKEPSCLR